MNKPAAGPILHAIVGHDDLLLVPILHLYETAFPAYERVPVADLLPRVVGEPVRHLRAVLDDSGVFVGLVIYQIRASCPQAAFLEYFATVPERRSEGWGGRTIAALLREIGKSAPDARIAVLEVEDPDECDAGEARQQAGRRIEFYRRHGARLLGGIRYALRVHGADAPYPMRLAFIDIGAAQPASAEDALRAAACLFGDAVTRINGVFFE